MKVMKGHVNDVFRTDTVYYTLKELLSIKTPNYENYYPVCAIYVLINDEYPGGKQFEPQPTLDYHIWKRAWKVLTLKNLKSLLLSFINQRIPEKKIRMMKNYLNFLFSFSFAFFDGRLING